MSSTLFSQCGILESYRDINNMKMYLLVLLIPKHSKTIPIQIVAEILYWLENT